VSYLQALWALLLCAGLSSAWLAASGAAAVSAARHAALRGASVALDRAQFALVESIASQAQSGASVFVAPTPGQRQPLCPERGSGASPCPLWVTTTAALAGQTAAGAGGANQTALNLQGAPAIAEQRIAAIVTATVATANRAPVATLSRRVTLRTLATWPYAALSGADEPRVDGVASGDFAGACAGGACGADSRVHAVLVCVDLAQPQNCAGQSPIPVDAFTSPPWYDGDAAPAGWSQ
jgi:hypothetical protein